MRKISDARETLLALTLAFIVAAWLGADPQLYFGFAAAAVGKSGVFNWGNSQEHKAKAGPQV
jgi:hypothetical protein